MHREWLDWWAKRDATVDRDTIPCLPPDDCGIEHGYIDAYDDGPEIVLYGGVE